MATIKDNLEVMPGLLCIKEKLMVFKFSSQDLEDCTQKAINLKNSAYFEFPGVSVTANSIYIFRLWRSCPPLLTDVMLT